MTEQTPRDRNEAAVSLYKDGHSLRDVATVLGCSHMTVSRALREHGIDPREHTTKLWGVTHECRKCGRVLPLSSFVRSKENSAGREWMCKECGNARRRTQNGTLSKYGMTQEHYHQMLDAQGGVCRICGAPPPTGGTAPRSRTRLCVDHDHITGKVRGLLCERCNYALGHVGDDCGILESMISYLRNAK